MKKKYIILMIHGAFIFGAFIAFCPVVFSALSDYSSAFHYVGAGITVCGIIFSILCLRYPICSDNKKMAVK
jgi:uncharacterized membrane protein YczE